MDETISGIVRAALASTNKKALGEMAERLEKAIAECEEKREDLSERARNYRALMAEINAVAGGNTRSTSKRGKRKALAENGNQPARQTRITQKRIRRAIIEYLEAWPHRAHLEETIRREIVASVPGMTTLNEKAEAFSKALQALVEEARVHAIVHNHGLPLYALPGSSADPFTDPEGEDDPAEIAADEHATADVEDA